ncbi:MAG: pyruvate kinase [Alphaproteobacteria bacterium]|nr:MAG: pyruvate kinase [Alphaproteobacteria bacterium]
MRRLRNTKIVATLGPASSTQEQIIDLIKSGADVFRLNFSHGSHEDHKKRFDNIRAAEKKLGRIVSILADLQGPKLRVGVFKDGPVMLKSGAKFRLDLDKKPGDEKRANMPHPEIFAALEKDTDLLLDDGKIRLRVKKFGKDFADCEVITGGKLSERKGVNVPGVVLPISALTEKDRKDMRFALDLGVDYVALSFVQRPQDVAEARKLIAGRAAVLIKVEKPQAVDCLDQLIELTDAVMVARGDLGVEMPTEDVPGIQKRIVRGCRKLGKPVIVATQMLESMITSPTPTRAEASDVATAVFDGADAVMLSAETASGQYPLEAVSIMNRIIEKVEKDPLYRQIMDAEHPATENTESDAMTTAASIVAEKINANAIVTFTTSGSTTWRAARQRPMVPVIGLTTSILTARRLALGWGIHPIAASDVNDFEHMVEIATKHAAKAGFAKKNDRIVITAGVPFGTLGATNILRIARIA